MRFKQSDNGSLSWLRSPTPSVMAAKAATHDSSITRCRCCIAPPVGCSRRSRTAPGRAQSVQYGLLPCCTLRGGWPDVPTSPLRALQLDSVPYQNACLPGRSAFQHVDPGSSHCEGKWDVETARGCPGAPSRAGKFPARHSGRWPQGRPGTRRAKKERGGGGRTRAAPRQSGLMLPFTMTWFQS